MGVHDDSPEAAHTIQHTLALCVRSFIGGFAISLLGSILFIVSTALFAILFSLGYLLSLIGTGFLVGCACESFECL